MQFFVMKNLILFLFFISSCLFNGLQARNIYDVTKFGAVGDGKTDNANAFLEAWKAVCENKANPTMRIPLKNTFMLTPITFAGPCKAQTINIQIRGNLIAPNNLWDPKVNDQTWLRFSHINNLVIDGDGSIDGQGSIWWKNCPKNNLVDANFQAGFDCNERPTGLHLHGLNNLKLTSIHHKNSPKNHISINECKGVYISGLNIVAPEDSPNTDGLDISKSSNIIIQDSIIATGDDCVAINTGSSYINVTGVTCGPGHGISIGSLGAQRSHAEVEEVHVTNCTLIKTQNGARIKTWKGGSGYAKKIFFEHLILDSVTHPIVIDQAYDPNLLEEEGLGSGSGSCVQLSEITFNDMHGTSANEIAIQLNCEKSNSCTQIVMKGVNLTSANPGHIVRSECTNAQGIASSVIPPISCLSSQS